MSGEEHPVLEAARELTPRLVEWRRHLHMHPEPSMQEHETARFVAERLREMGLEDIREGIGETGVVAVIWGQGEATVALRADMDALEMTEETGAEYASQREGMMHACGHDAHTACLLGAAAILSQRREELPGNVKLIFQPGEEGAGGALRMIEDGCLQEPQVAAIAALHVFPELASGQIGLNWGFMTAQSDSVDLAVIGDASHAARPHLGTDAISVAAQAVAAIEQFIGRSTDPMHRKVVSFGTISGGTRRNVLADRVELQGTIRTYEMDTRERIVDFIGNRLRDLVAAMGARLQVQIQEGYPPLWNEEWVLEAIAEAARQVLGDDAVEELPYPSLGAEDFAFFQRVGEIPTAMIRLGTRDEAGGYVWPIHSTRFDLNDKQVLPAGAAVLAQTAVTLLERAD
ncbi:MAG: M20 family metallopeptidase [Armatimonadota bacterium]|nr:M20 family metallopeptidase [Armatimonadota bacterium]